MTPARAFELLTKLAVLVIAPAGALTVFWLAALSGAQPADCDTSSNCGAGSLLGLLSCPTGLVLALAALPLIVTRWRGRIRRQEVWRAPEWWRFGVAAPLLLTAAGLDFAGLQYLMSLGQ